MIANDDCEWLKNEGATWGSVTAALVADLFGKTDEEVKRDLLKLYDIPKADR
jgi:hypothetical protein